MDILLFIIGIPLMFMALWFISLIAVFLLYFVAISWVAMLNVITFGRFNKLYKAANSKLDWMFYDFMVLIDKDLK